MLKITLASLVLLTFASGAKAQAMDHSAHSPSMSHGQRQADVVQRGKDVMPFSLAATTHIFAKTAQGGVQQVVVKNANDAEQVRLTRLHLKEIRGQFLKGDFRGQRVFMAKTCPA